MGRYSSFGLPKSGPETALAPDEAIALLKRGDATPDSLLGFGNGRSYGDSCHNRSGHLIDMRAMGGVIAFDEQDGVIEAEAGLMLSDLIAHVLPLGFFPPVTPGTRFITLGGAIANDVHGKNHHRRGTFGCHVEALKLLRSDGKVRCCSRDKNAKLFHATIGGMGLTGLILSATIRLMKVPGADVTERVTPFTSLEEYFAMAAEADFSNEYAVAWIDQLATGRSEGRGLLLTANHMGAGYEGRQKSSRLAVPFQPPLNILNRPFLKAFNTAYYYKRAMGGSAPRHSSWQGYFYPLDGITNWNRLYGPHGLCQHQSIIPEVMARDAVPELLRTARADGHSSFLTVLKRFGDVASPGLLSFPRKGYTLTLDFANRGEATMKLLEKLDRITVEAGGAVNAYKDARMSAETFDASYPNWRELETMRDPAFSSDFWKRTAGQLEVYPKMPALAAE